MKKNIRSFTNPPWCSYLLSLLLVFLVLCIAILCMVPPVSRDALTHHLFVPKLYLQHGGIYEIPEIPFSYYPMNLDLLYTVALYLGSDILPKFIHFSFALMTAWLLFNYLKKRISPVYGLLASLFFLSIPIIVKLSITVYVDLGLMFFVTASLMLLFRWLNTKNGVFFLVLAGICCGLAAGVKYNGLISLFLLPLFVPVLYIRSRNQIDGVSRKGVIYGFVFLFAAFIAFSPWPTRNYLWTGNPIYPLYDSIFQQKEATEVLQKQDGQEGKESVTILDKIADRSSGVFTSRKILYNESWWQTVLLPVRFFFEGKDDNPQYFDGKLTPFLLILPLFAFTRRSEFRFIELEKKALLYFSLTFFFFTFFQEAMRIRYIVSIVPALVILSMFGLNNIHEAMRKQNLLHFKHWSTSTLAILCIAIFSYNTAYIVKQYQYVRPLSFISGEVSRDEYISNYRPEYPVIQFANSILQRETKVLCLFLGKRGYYMDFKPIFENPFQKGILSGILNKNDSRKVLKTKLLDYDIKYILLRNDLTQKWYYSLSTSKKNRVTSFFRDFTTMIFEGHNFSLYEIK